MQWLDILIFAGFILFTLYSGLRSQKIASESLEEYFLAGRSLTGWQAGISMAATKYAADTPLLITGLIATGGIFALWQVWMYAVAFLFLGFILAAQWRRAAVITDAEFSELRYGEKAAKYLRGIKAVYLGIVFNCFALAIVFLATTRITEPFLTWHEWLPAGLFSPLQSMIQWANVPLTVLNEGSALYWVNSTNNFISLLLILLVTLFYSTLGGLRSVVMTDVVQFGVAMVATLAYAIFLLNHVGGVSGLYAAISERFAAGGPGGILPTQLLAFTPDQAFQASTVVLFVFAFQWIAQNSSDGTGYLAQRALACKSDQDAKMATIIFSFMHIVLRSLFWLPIALSLLVIFPPDLALSTELIRADREYTFVRGIAEMLPMGLKGLMIVGMFGALASTVDTHLNCGASYVTNDLYKRFFSKRTRSEESQRRRDVFVARLSNVIILITALFIMTRMHSIQSAWKMAVMLGASTGVMLLLRWFWWRINAWSEIVCLASALIMLPFVMTYFGEEGRILFMAIVPANLGILAALITGPGSMKHLQAFYDKVQPLGLWSPFAAKDAPSPFWVFARLVSAVILACGSLFSWLVGAGSLIVQSPAPSFFPNAALWPYFNLLLGCFLVPIWWRLSEVNKAILPAAKAGVVRVWRVAFNRA